jgi:hypothetical protein
MDRVRLPNGDFALKLILGGMARSEEEKAELNHLLGELSRQIEFDPKRVEAAIRCVNGDVSQFSDAIVYALMKHELMSEQVALWAEKWIAFNIKLMVRDIFNGNEMAMKKGKAKLDIDNQEIN